MARAISDGDIETFLRRNVEKYPSQISLIQAAVHLLWPNGAPTGGAERVVRVCLGQNLASLPESATSPRATRFAATGSQAH
jgi:hypothetical protein